MTSIRTISKVKTNTIDDDADWEIFDKISDNNIKPKTTSLNCESCKSDDIIMDTTKGYTVCRTCGVTEYNNFDKGPEWSFYDDDKEGGRCGAPTNHFLPKSSLGTSIGGMGSNRVKMLQKWSQMPYKERSLYEVLQKIDNKCRKYNITKAIIDNAKILYKHVSDTKHETGLNKGKNIIIRGINRESLIAACVFYGAKLQKFPRSPKEIADIFDLKLTQVTKGCRKFLEIMETNPILLRIQSSHASDFIERYSGKLKIKKEYIAIAIKIANNINKLDLISDHQPPSIAAGSIMIMSDICELNINKRIVSEIFGISEVTIAKTYNRIQKYQKILADDELVDKVLKSMKKEQEQEQGQEQDQIFNDDGLDDDLDE